MIASLVVRHQHLGPSLPCPARDLDDSDRARFAKFHEGGCAVASSVSRDDLPVEKMGDYESRSTELDDFTISFESTPAGFAGEAYYLRPGHWFESVADSEAVEFSPTETLRTTVEVVQRNMSSEA